MVRDGPKCLTEVTFLAVSEFGRDAGRARMPKRGDLFHAPAGRLAGRVNMKDRNTVFLAGFRSRNAQTFGRKNEQKNK